MWSSAGTRGARLAPGSQLAQSLSRQRQTVTSLSGWWQCRRCHRAHMEPERGLFESLKSFQSQDCMATMAFSQQHNLFSQKNVDFNVLRFTTTKKLTQPKCFPITVWKKKRKNSLDRILCTVSDIADIEKGADALQISWWRYNKGLLFLLFITGIP